MATSKQIKMYMSANNATREQAEEHFKQHTTPKNPDTAKLIERFVMLVDGVVKIYEVKYFEHMFDATLEKYELRKMDLDQLSDWMKKVGNKLEDGEEWACSMTYMLRKKYTPELAEQHISSGHIKNYF